jgi:hypothetical protein
VSCKTLLTGIPSFHWNVRSTVCCYFCCNLSSTSVLCVLFCFVRHCFVLSRHGIIISALFLIHSPSLVRSDLFFLVCSVSSSLNSSTPDPIPRLHSSYLSLIFLSLPHPFLLFRLSPSSPSLSLSPPPLSLSHPALPLSRPPPSVLRK